jgi:branched-chain amino acid transport system substrate-binding protein
MRKIIFAIMLLSMVFLSACNPTGNVVAENQQEIKIGALYTMSGDYADFFRGVGKGIEYAVNDFEEKYPSIDVEVILEDDVSCDKKTSVSAMNKLVNVDKVSAVVGTTCSSVTLATGPIAEDNKVILISGSSSSKDISSLGDYIFRTYPSDEQRSKAAAEYLEETNVKKVALVYESENDGAFSLVDDLSKYLDKSVSREFFRVSASERDFRTLITKLKQENYDSVVMSFMGTGQIVSFIQQSKELTFEVPFFSIVESAQDEKVLEITEDKELVYAIFEPVESKQYLELQRRYVQDTGEEVMPQYVAENYDGTMLVLEALYKANKDSKQAKNLLYSLGKNYKGKSGIIDFDENGDVEKMPVLKTIENGEFVKLS